VQVALDAVEPKEACWKVCGPQDRSPGPAVGRSESWAVTEDDGEDQGHEGKVEGSDVEQGFDEIDRPALSIQGVVPEEARWSRCCPEARQEVHGSRGELRTLTG